MRYSFLKPLLTTVLCTLFPLIAYAQDADAGGKLFQDTCVKTWMERATDTTDKVAFQNFGEKYCSCAAGKDLHDDAAMQKAAQLCMSQVLLHDAMASLEDQYGLPDLTESQIEAGCQDKWALVYPDMNPNVKSKTTNYCQCAGPELDAMNKNANNLTDKAWSEKIDEIAAKCSGLVEPDKATTDVKPTTI